MWSKISNALKPRQGNEQEPEPSIPHTQADVLSRVYEQHPNMSVFHNADIDAPLPTPSPPGSPSKHSRRGMFKRMSKIPKGDDSDSPLKLPIGLPKKVRSHLQLRGNSSQSSLARGSVETTRPSVDTLRSPQDPSRPSLESMQGLATPVLDMKYGSVRSILRDPKTPGTGQNVRFFSRDAYKMISPEVSMDSNPDPISFADRLHKAQIEKADSSRPPRPSAMELFSPHEEEEVASTPSSDILSFMAPPPVPNESNIFDLSQEHELPTIPMYSEPLLLDTAIEMPNGDNGSIKGTITSTPFKEQEGKRDGDSASGQHDRSLSFSFGQTMFHSMGKSSPTDSVKSNLINSERSASPATKNRSRAMSDTVFQSIIKPKKSDIEDDSTSALVVYASPEPDPFRVNATTYYTPQTMIPTTPPKGVTHMRKTSREEDLIWSLRTQLALQQELCAQFEIDLSARDELVHALTTRLENAEKENDKRKGVLRTWKKKAAELEKMCRHLEEEVDLSRQESMERSVMDEASSEALRQLHRQISHLEREKGEVENREASARAEKGVLAVTLKDRDDEIEQLKSALKRRDDSQRALQDGIREAKEQIEQMGVADGDDELKALMARTERAGEEERERHRDAESSWTEERKQLKDHRDQLEKENADLLSELEACRDLVTRKTEEYDILKNELEAQWKHTETAGEKVEDLVKERDTLKTEIEALEGRIESMEEEWNDHENHRLDLENELQEALDATEVSQKEHEELNEQLRNEREHADHLTQALQEREDHVAELESERQYSSESISRLEENIKQRNTEIDTLSQRVVQREAQAEELREQLANQKRDHTHQLDKQKRELGEMTMQEKDAREQMEVMIKENAESDVLLGTLKERVNALKDEVERMRRQIHELQQESADKEVKVMQLTKQRSQDKEDLNGLNIALDSKQQELELLKRKAGMRGTAGSTPAQPSKIQPRSRESAPFSTPSTSRPSSALSDVSKDGLKERKLSDPPSAIARPSLSALSKSARMNAASGSLTSKVTGSMGPPPAKFSRPSLSGTPTPASTKLPSSLLRSTSARPGPSTPTASTMRKMSGSSLNQSQKSQAGVRRFSAASTPSEQDEKENMDDTPAGPTKSMRRTNLVPA